MVVVVVVETEEVVCCSVAHPEGPPVAPVPAPPLPEPLAGLSWARVSCVLKFRYGQVC